MGKSDRVTADGTEILKSAFPNLIDRTSLDAINDALLKDDITFCRGHVDGKLLMQQRDNEVYFLPNNSGGCSIYVRYWSSHPYPNGSETHNINHLNPANTSDLAIINDAKTKMGELIPVTPGVGVALDGSKGEWFSLYATCGSHGIFNELVGTTANAGPWYNVPHLSSMELVHDSRYHKSSTCGWTATYYTDRIEVRCSAVNNPIYMRVCIDDADSDSAKRTEIMRTGYAGVFSLTTCGKNSDGTLKPLVRGRRYTVALAIENSVGVSRILEHEIFLLMGSRLSGNVKRNSGAPSSSIAITASIPQENGKTAGYIAKIVYQVTGKKGTGEGDFTGCETFTLTSPFNDTDKTSHTFTQDIKNSTKVPRTGTYYNHKYYVRIKVLAKDDEVNDGLWAGVNHRTSEAETPWKYIGNVKTIYEPQISGVPSQIYLGQQQITGIQIKIPYGYDYRMAIKLGSTKILDTDIFWLDNTSDINWESDDVTETVYFYNKDMGEQILTNDWNSFYKNYFDNSAMSEVADGISIIIKMKEYDDDGNEVDRISLTKYVKVGLVGGTALAPGQYQNKNISVLSANVGWDTLAKAIPHTRAGKRGIVWVKTEAGWKRGKIC